MATLHPLVAGRLGRWRNAVAPVTVDGAPVDRCPDTPTAEIRAGVLAAIADLRRFAGPIAPRAELAELDGWRRTVWLASDDQVRACHETWAAQIVRCVASIRTVGGTC